MWHALATHWPEYLMEGALLGIFMVSACLNAALLNHPASPVVRRLPNATIRRALMGVAMGFTAIALIYSPWGGRSGAHMNPAFTLAMLTLGKVAPWDALFYAFFQSIGGLGGVGLCAAILPRVISHADVAYVTTVPGPRGPRVALAGEVVIATIMMAMVLVMLSLGDAAAYTGVVAGVLVALFITIEAPLSGMGLNPARSLASALVARRFNSLWIYLLAPVVAMQGTAITFAGIAGTRSAHCAKLNHPDSGPCIFGCSAD